MPGVFYLSCAKVYLYRVVNREVARVDTERAIGPAFLRAALVGLLLGPGSFVGHAFGRQADRSRVIAPTLRAFEVAVEKLA